MSRPLILVVMLIYFYVAAEQGYHKNYAATIVWGAYGVANLGLWMLAK